MNKVITINLHGNAYQLEESGYDALRAYLETAARRLEGNPDRDEIIADIEQAIADKFRALLGANKTVVVAKEVGDVIAQMGPVEGTGEGSAQPGAASAGSGAAAPPSPSIGSTAGPRRLYKIREGAQLDGVCNGLAAYMGIDVTVVRIAFCVLTFLYGGGLLIYLFLMVILPAAETPEQRSAAQGAPTTAEEFIRRAREGYYDGMKNLGDRQAYREWKRKFRQDMRALKWNLKWRMHTGFDPRAPQAAPSPLAWVSLSVLGLASAALTILWLVAMYTLVTTGAILGLSLPAGIPVWLGVILLIIVYKAFKWPLRAMRYGFYGRAPCFSPFHFLWCALSWILFVWVLIWLFSNHPGSMHEFVRGMDQQFHQAVHAFKAWWERQ